MLSRSLKSCANASRMQSVYLRSIVNYYGITNNTFTIFGASTGFLGRYVVDELAKKNGILKIPCRGDLDEHRHLKPLGHPGYINPIPFDPRDEESIRECIRHSNVVINLIGKYYETKHVFGTSINYTQQATNVEVPQRIARISKEMGVKHFIHCSALQQNPYHPSEWCRTKAIGEKVVRDEFPEAVIVRPADMFGVEDRFLNWFAQVHAYAPSLCMINGENARKQPVYVGDVAEAIRRIVSDIDKYEGKTFEFAGSQVKSIREIIEYMYEICHFKPKLGNISKSMARKIAYICEFFPNPKIVRDDVEIRCSDNVLSPESTALKFSDLGMTPTPFEKEARNVFGMYRIKGTYTYQYFVPPPSVNPADEWNLSKSN